MIGVPLCDVASLKRSCELVYIEVVSGELGQRYGVQTHGFRQAEGADASVDIVLLLLLDSGCCR